MQYGGYSHRIYYDPPEDFMAFRDTKLFMTSNLLKRFSLNIFEGNS